MDDDQQFCLRWNNHQSTLISVFDTLLEKGIHVDCTLAAEGQTLKAHKVVLSACSPYFESVLSQQYDKHPIIILKDVKYAELRAMMDYMYRGEVNISQDQLAALLKAAESLQIKGLSDNKPPPRTSSPSLKGRVLETASTGHLHSREGSSSPAPRKRKKPRRASADSINISTEHIPSQNHTAIQPPVPIKNNIEHIENDVVVPIKVNKVSNDIVNDVIKINNKSEVADDAKIEFEEGNEDSVEDLTLDEEADSEIDSAHQISAGPSIGQGDVVQSFQWHMERSQDEVINTQDSQRDSQDASVLTLDSNKEIKSLLGVPVIDLDLETSLLDEEFDADESDSSILQFSSNKKFLILKPDDEELKHLISDTVQNNLIPSLETKTEDTVGSGLDDSKENDKIIINEAASEERGESKKGDTEVLSPPQPSLPCAQYATPKGYKCPNCQRIYNARKNLVRHINLECGREPQYRCPYCSHGNHRRNELKRHIQKKHPDKPDCDVPPKVAC